MLGGIEEIRTHISTPWLILSLAVLFCVQNITACSGVAAKLQPCCQHFKIDQNPVSCLELHCGTCPPLFRTTARAPTPAKEPLKLESFFSLIGGNTFSAALCSFAKCSPTLILSVSVSDWVLTGW